MYALYLSGYLVIPLLISLVFNRGHRRWYSLFFFFFFLFKLCPFLSLISLLFYTYFQVKCAGLLSWPLLDLHLERALSPLHVLSAIVIALKTFHFPVCVLFRRCFSFILFFLHFQLSPLFNGVIQIVGATTTKREKKENKQKRIYKRRGESA